MAALIVASVLLGAILQGFFRVLVLVPASAILLAVIAVRSAYLMHSLLRPILEFIVAITSLQSGYASAVLLAAIRGLYQRAKKRRGQARPVSLPGQLGSSRHNDIR